VTREPSQPRQVGGTRPVLLVVTPYFPPEGGGLEFYASNLCHLLSARHGWRIVVVTSGEFRGHVRQQDEDGIRVYRLPYQIRASHTRFGLTWRRELRRIIQHEHPDLINAHAPVPGLADVVAGLKGPVPLVLTYHSGSMRKGRWQTDSFISLYELVLRRRLLERAEWIIASSHFVRDCHLTRLRPKCSVVTPGVDATLFTPAPSVALNRVLFVGGLNRSEAHKGLDRLLRAVADLHHQFPSLELDVVGSGDHVPHYRALCGSLGLGGHVQFLGRLAGPELALAYRRATVLALPTTNDSFPLVLLEAMASGLPVVSTTVGGIPELVEDGTHGFLVDPGDDVALTERLSRVLGDPQLAARLGGAGRARAKSLSWEGQATRTDTILRSVLKGNPGEGTHRLAVVAPHFHPRIGGVEHYAAQVALGFSGLDDYEVVVFTSRGRGLRTLVEVQKGLTVFRLARWATVSNTPVSPLWSWQMRRVMASNRIDIVNAHTPVPFMAEAAALACRGRPFVLTYHSGSMLKNRPIVDVLIRLYERRLLPRLLHRADAVVSVSPAVTSRLPLDAPEKTFLVPPGVDDSIFTPGDDHAEGPPTLLFVGRIERTSAWKGIDVLLEAFALVLRQLPEARLTLVGDGDAVGDHRNAAKILGILDQTEFRGALRGSALVEAYQQASVFVLPSTTESEAAPMTLTEAMACRKPVVASAVGGVPFMIDDHHDGLLVPPGDPEQLAAACLRLLLTPEMATAMGEQAYLKVKSLTWASRVAAYEAIFEGLLPPAEPSGGGSPAVRGLEPVP
jgi:glycosyltransferase involved in cell wall biosynthesis